MSEYVSLKQLAETLGMDRSHARRFVLRLGYKPLKRRTAESGNQLALAVTAEEAETIVQARKERGFLASEHDAIPNEYGVFYAVQLVPDLDPRRVKLGFASTIEERLSQHRTAAPTATVLKTWACRRSWERAAMDSLTQGFEHIGGEVYECGDLDFAVACSSGDVEILLNDGCGTLYARFSQNVGITPFAAAIGDLEGAGGLDLAVANFGDQGSSVEGTVSVLLHGVCQSFDDDTLYDVGIRPVAVAIGDIDRDCDNDLAVANENSDSVSVLINDGDGFFTPGQSYSVPGPVEGLTFDDFDGDGDLDLAVAGNAITILLNRRIP